MTLPDLAKQIQSEALRLNYEKCGLIRLTKMDEYVEKVRQRLDSFPDGSSVLATADWRRCFP